MWCLKIIFVALLASSCAATSFHDSSAQIPFGNELNENPKSEQLSVQKLDDDLAEVIESSQLLSLHRALVEIESISNDELAVAKFLRTTLEAHNFTVKLQEVEQPADLNTTEKRYNVYAYPDVKSYDFDGLATHEPKVLLTSHIDTVPPFIPYTLSRPHSKTMKHDRKDILISGRGTVDAKACVAAMVQTTLEMLSASEVNPQDIALLFVVSEENSGLGMTTFSDSKLYSSTNSKYKAIIFGEPTEAKLASGHKGIQMTLLKAKGKAAHSGYPWLGRSANSMILPALMVLDKLGDIAEADGGLPRSKKYGKSTVNVGYMTGGVAANVVPEHAEAKVAMRLAGGTPEQVKEIVLNAIAGADPDGLLEVMITQGYGPVALDADVEGFESMTVNYGTDVPNLRVADGVKKYLYGPGSILVAHGANEGLTVGELEKAVVDYKKLVKHAMSL